MACRPQILVRDCGLASALYLMMLTYCKESGLGPIHVCMRTTVPMNTSSSAVWLGPLVGHGFEPRRGLIQGVQTIVLTLVHLTPMWLSSSGKQTYIYFFYPVPQQKDGDSSKGRRVCLGGRICLIPCRASCFALVYLKEKVEFIHFFNHLRHNSQQGIDKILPPKQTRRLFALPSNSILLLCREQSKEEEESLPAN